MKTNQGFGASLKYLLPLFALLPLQAFGLLWTGGSLVSSNWSDSANWGGTSIAPGDALFYGGTAGLNNTNDTASGTSYSSITFNPGAGSFVLNGNLLNIANGITNDSLVPQTVNLGISFSNSITLNGASSTLNVLAGLTNAVSAPVATTITLAGTGILGNLFTGYNYPLETNIFAITNNANWTIVDNSVDTGNEGPWVFQIDSGTMSFGTPSVAPFFESDNQNGSPMDNEIATVAGATGVLNVVNGTLALSPDLDMAVAANSTATVNIDGALVVSSNLDTALGANSTAIINMNSGSLTIGGQFLGAEGNNPGEVSLLNADDGSLSINNGSGPLYVASCGTGSLTVSNNAIINCGILDISRNANGNSFGSAGTVHLDGGTLQVNSVTTASSNAQTGGSPTAAFYFNGGTLTVKKDPAGTFFQGSQVAPIIPITTIVQSGGAIIDVGNYNEDYTPVTFVEPLQHDPALGNAQDGGLTKLDVGDLVLMGTNTYNGNTVISQGTLSLAGSASIADSPEIIVTGSAAGGVVGKFDVSGLSSTFILGSNQTLSNSVFSGWVGGNFNTASGTLSLTYSSGTPSLIVSNGTLTLSSSTLLRINNTGSPLGAGIYTIIQTNGVFYMNVIGGMVSGTVPSSFTVNGGGIVPGKTASLQINNGQLQLVVTPGPSQALDLLWTGGSLASRNWSDSANWGGTNIVPGDALFFGGTVGLNNTNDTISGTSYSNITFNPGAESFVLNGNLLTIANGITNDSLVPQTVNLGISFSNSITLNGAGNVLNVLAGLTNAVSAPVATTITLVGSGTLGNFFPGFYYPLETNVFVITNNAYWTIVDNSRSAVNTGPWAFQIDSGTMSFGTPSNAPFCLSDNHNGSPLDNEIATVPGATGTLNVIKGTLALSPDLDMATVANSIAQTYISGGTLSVSNGPLYVASCGTGTLTISNGTVKCGTLDISRNANGISSGSVGTVYLDGGTLLVNNVTNASSNAQAGGSPTATFYFNGGTLAANSDPERTFFQGSQVAPFMPITTIVQARGAIVDVNPNNNLLVPAAIAEPLQHDPALGSAQDGGLTKVDTGELVLLGANTYNGNTVISNGTLALSGSASIANSPEIVIVSAANLNFAAKFDVSQLSSAFTLGSGQVLSNTAPPAIIAGNFNSAQGTLSLTYSPGVQSLVLSNSIFTLASGTVLKINNLGAALGTGTYTIIGTNSGYAFGNIGMVTGTVPSSFTVDGGGIAPGTAASLQINKGLLQLVVAPGPRITGVSLNGPTLTLTGTNGMAGGQYVLLQSTNITLPLSQWIPVLTNKFDNNGDLNLSTNIVNPNNPMEFYLLLP